MGIITIDGPAGSGKSTISKLLAKELGISFLDTGAMYRALTLMAMNAGLDLQDSAKIKELFDKTELKFSSENNKTVVEINGVDCSDLIRSPQVTANVHFIAAAPILRESLVELQRQFAKEQGSIVTEGRDQGSVVFPDAEVKIYLNADVDQRANRRFKELQARGEKCDLQEIKDAIIARDCSDRNREVGSLKKAADAIEIDTSHMSIDEVVRVILEIVRK